MSTQRLQNVAQVFKREIDQGKLTGAVIMIARDGKLVYSEAVGFQDKEGSSPKPMAKDAIFRIYSMTKPFVSVAAMMLVEDGRIVLTDPLSKYLPEFKGLQVSVARTDPYGKTTYALVAAEREATVQDLLRHSAGLAYGEVSPTLRSGKPTKRPGCSDLTSSTTRATLALTRRSAISRKLHSSTSPGPRGNTASQLTSWAVLSSGLQGSVSRSSSTSGCSSR